MPEITCEIGTEKMTDRLDADMMVVMVVTVGMAKEGDSIAEKGMEVEAVIGTVTDVMTQKIEEGAEEMSAGTEGDRHLLNLIMRGDRGTVGMKETHVVARGDIETRGDLARVMILLRGAPEDIVGIGEVGETAVVLARHLQSREEGGAVKGDPGLHRGEGGARAIVRSHPARLASVKVPGENVQHPLLSLQGGVRAAKRVRKRHQKVRRRRGSTVVEASEDITLMKKEVTVKSAAAKMSDRHVGSDPVKGRNQRGVRTRGKQKQPQLTAQARLSHLEIGRSWKKNSERRRSSRSRKEGIRKTRSLCFSLIGSAACLTFRCLLYEVKTVLCADAS
mmetsp:Transcript_48524/g.125911  ORF Transcript_48524/g.125911 Transcript_48524/m.125911 type:complete len:334 (+) Transcript_48524:624-1625(+)